MKDIILVGNPNSGKSTLLNTLTGMRTHVGNFPGVTVDVATGLLLPKYASIKRASVTDLPGIYSLTPFSADEAVAVRLILRVSETDSVIINVAESGSLARSLALTLQLLETGKPVVLAINDVSAGEPRALPDAEKLSRKLGIPVAIINARSGKNIHELLEKAARVHESRSNITQVKTTSDTYEARQTARYDYAEDILRASGGGAITETHSAMTKIVISFSLAVSCLAVCGGFLLGDFLRDLLVTFSSELKTYLSLTVRVRPALTDLVCGGLISGVGNVLCFLPSVCAVFLFISVLEDTGLMARAAAALDKPLSKIGLSGKAALPLLLGFGCTVPAVMSARGLSSRKERLLVALTVPFMSCSAKIPVYVLLAGVFFYETQIAVILLLYLSGIAIFLIVSAFLSRITPGETTFLMEIPVLRIPNPANTAAILREKARDFLRRAFGIILLFSVGIWFLGQFAWFDGRLTLSASIDGSLLSDAARFISPIFAPLGFGDWRVTAALLTGLTAKEAVVSTLSVLFDGNPAAISAVLPVSGAAPLMMFILLYSPCAAAIATMKREIFPGGSAVPALIKTVLLMLAQCALAWGAAFAVRIIAALLL